MRSIPRTLRTRSPRPGALRTALALSALALLGGAELRAQQNCVPYRLTNSWTVVGTATSGETRVEVGWPGQRYLDRSEFTLHFAVSRGGPASLDLGCGLIVAPDRVTVSMSTGLGSQLSLAGSGSVSIDAYGSGPILAGSIAQHLLVGPGALTPSTTRQFSASLAQGSYDQLCGLLGSVSGPGASPPGPGGPERAYGTGGLTCALDLPPGGTFTTSVDGLQLVPEPPSVVALAAGLALLGAWRRRRPRGA